MCFLFAGCVSGHTSNFFSSLNKLLSTTFTVKVWRIWRHPIRLLPVAIAAMSVRAESPAACWGNSGATWQTAPADWRKEVQLETPTHSRWGLLVTQAATLCLYNKQYSVTIKTVIFNGKKRHLLWKNPDVWANRVKGQLSPIWRHIDNFFLTDFVT